VTPKEELEYATEIARLTYIDETVKQVEDQIARHNERVGKDTTEMTMLRMKIAEMEAEHLSQTPLIITVFDKKKRSQRTTVVDYSRVDDVVAMIKETLEKKEWTYRIYCPPTETQFILTIKSEQ
jgi:hypothetical protein